MSSANPGSEPAKTPGPLSPRERGFILAGIGGLCGIAWGKLLLHSVALKSVGGFAGPIGGYIILSGPSLAMTPDVCQRRSKNASVGRSKNASDGVAQRAPAGALCAGRIQAGLLALD